MALPGSGMTPTTVEACASALDESPCELPAGPPTRCNFNGSLGAARRATRVSSARAANARAPWRTAPTARLVRSPAAPVRHGRRRPGLVARETFPRAARRGWSASRATRPPPSRPTRARAGRSRGDVRLPVGHLRDRPVLRGSDAEVCCARGGRDAVRRRAPPSGVAGRVRAPAELRRSARRRDVRNPAGGRGFAWLHRRRSSCALGCVPGPCSSSGARIGCSESGTCASVRWAGSGETCDGYATRCLVGPCSVSPAQSQGTCPAVVPEGQPCAVAALSASAPTCDTFAQRLLDRRQAGRRASGTCTLLDSIVCVSDPADDSGSACGPRGAGRQDPAGGYVPALPRIATEVTIEDGATKRGRHEASGRSAHRAVRAAATSRLELGERATTRWSRLRQHRTARDSP